jgi:hypothetical protein
MKFDNIELQGTPLRQIKKDKTQELRKGKQFMLHYCYSSCYLVTRTTSKTGGELQNGKQFVLH